MFTGVVTDLGRVRAIEPGGDTRLVIATTYDNGTIAIGASIACSGACLTVIETGPDWLAVQASAETLAHTTLAGWQVTGHVDGVAHIENRVPEGDSLRFTVAAAPNLARFVAPKGSVCLDGVSLTVNEVDGERFGVNIVPHTQQITTFGEAEAGTAVNMEIDLLARYVARLLEGD
jgi:riboflavin synthase